jgi:2-polyprenyl-6-hydroxyphenyl methylase/3-demethylubiquinone-9 3-methyltransferase
MSAALAAPSIDPREVERFAAMAEGWWDPNGKFRPLHVLNPVRLAYSRDRAIARFGLDPKERRVLTGLTLLDIGCGGGLVAEPLARLGASVTGIDAGEQNIGVATAHAAQTGTAVDYRAISAEALAAEGRQFDIVLALEIVEHVADVGAFMDAATALVRPGGLLVMATLNRTPKAFALAIVGAEWVLRWLPRGTHDWKKFVRPSELARELRRNGLALQEIRGVTYNPLSDRWALSADTDVNYMIAAHRPSA